MRFLLTFWLKNMTLFYCLIHLLNSLIELIRGQRAEKQLVMLQIARDKLETGLSKRKIAAKIGNNPNYLCTYAGK